MKIENTEVMGLKGAFRGMRNALESWEKSDSYFGIGNEDEIYGYLDSYIMDYIPSDYMTYQEEEDVYNKLLEKYSEQCVSWDEHSGQYYMIGKEDMKLAKKLTKAGTEQRKFLRMIHVQVDITAPLYFWKEFDTYKVATTSNSTSTMHKLATTPITINCFETDDYNKDLLVYEYEPYKENSVIENCVEYMIEICETLRQRYLETKDKRYWKELIRLLPESWLQTRTIDINYETLINMYYQRKYHKLTEWHTICNWIEELPYMKDFLSAFD